MGVPGTITSYAKLDQLGSYSITPEAMYFRSGSGEAAAQTLVNQIRLTGSKGKPEMPSYFG